MLPIVHLFGCTVQSYYLCAALAGLTGLVLSAYTLKREGLGAWRFLLPLLMAIAALVGARTLNFLLDPGAYGPDFPVWSLAYRSLSLMGGLICGVLTVFAFGALTKCDPFKLTDVLVLPAGISVALLKLGCFLNGCCFGKPTQGILGVEIPANETMYDYLETLPLFGRQVRTVYPTQFFEMMGALAGLAIVECVCRRRKLPEGGRAILYATWFTLVRLAVHPIRSFPYEKRVVALFYPMFYCTVLIALAVTFFMRMKRVSMKEEG